MSSVSEAGTAAHQVLGDTPIRSPEHDAYGLDPIARAIARSVSASDANEGLVYAVNGPWGSGKSSVINLIQHHLSEDISAGRIASTAFNPWWFSGAEALTVSFFQEMRAIVGKSVDEQTREAIANLGGRLSAAGPLLGGLASLIASPAAGAAVAGGAAMIEKLTRLDSTVEAEYRKIAAALSAQDKKFLIVIDDIDRLSTDDALQIFKLIKSVGRLPNVIYLLAFDRGLAEKMIAERFPAEGGAYLEKIIQGAFELPIPDPDDLKDQLLESVGKVMGAPPDEKMQRFWNLYYDIVAPLIKTPRDVVRLSNSVKVSWPSVEGNVDRADFLAMESLRLLAPAVHQAIRNNGSILTGTAPDAMRDQKEARQEYDGLFVDIVPSPQRETIKRALRRLFPRLEAVWSNMFHTGDRRWWRDRLICAPEHFPTYFSFGVINGGITAIESDALIAASGTSGATAESLLRFLEAPRRKGGTRAALALQELTNRAGDIPKKNIPHLLREVFEIADKLDAKEDNERGFGGLGSNETRIHWLLNNLLLDRLDLAVRSDLIRDAAPYASLAFLVSLSDRCKSIKEDRGTDKDRGYENLVDDDTVDWLFELSLERLRSAAASGSLVETANLSGILYRWRDRSSADEVRTWTDAQIKNDLFVIALAKDVIQESWSYAMGGFGSLGDRVSRKTEYVNLKPMEPMLDIDRFQERVSTLLESGQLSSDDQAALERFQNAPKRDPGLFSSSDDKKQADPS